MEARLIISQSKCMPLYLNINKAEYLFTSWDKGTFPNRMQSIRYHLQKHGNGRSYNQYTQDALKYFSINRDKASPIILKNGKNGLSIKTRECGVRQGGYWTEDGKIVTFWD